MNKDKKTYILYTFNNTTYKHYGLQTISTSKSIIRKSRLHKHFQGSRQGRKKNLNKGFSPKKPKVKKKLQTLFMVFKKGFKFKKNFF